MSEQENTFNPENTTVKLVKIEEEMEKSYIDYSVSVIVGRALPDVRDGLKPVHRRIMYKLYEMGLYPEKAYRKCADIVGNVLGSYHPHGDASVYDALVRMAQDFSLRYPLVDGHGNFGSIDGDPAAAYRYTEAKMSKISMNLLSDIDKETVDTKSNYDDRLQEPVVLPIKFPNLLVNGSSGIAVGMATNIPPHNLRETIDAVSYLIDNPDAEALDLMDYIKGPDFPTAGIIMGQSGIRSAYATGRGKITLRSRAEIVQDKNNKTQIVVTEIPYMVNKSKLLENIVELINAKRIDGISNIIDQSSNRTGLRVVIYLKRDANAQVVLNKLYQLTQLQTTVGVIMLALEDGKRPKVMTLKEMLQNYIKFQREVITRRTIYLLKKAKQREHIVQALKVALDFIDEVIAIIRSSKTISESKSKLIERFNFDDVQASAIVAMRLGQLSGMEREKIEDELAQLKLQIAEYEDILSDESKIDEIIKQEHSEIREKYGDERKTEIKSVSGEVDIEDLIPVEDCVITLTHYGYIKRQPVDVYRSQNRGGRGVSGMTRREEDFVQELFISSSHDYILFFTNFGKLYRLKCYEIPEGSRTSRGMNVVNILPLSEGENIQAMIKVSESDDNKYICMITKNGIIKRIELDAFKNVRKTGIRAIGLDDDDSLSFVRLTNGSNEIIIATYNGNCIRIQESIVRTTGRSSRGVIAIKLRDNDYVVGMARVREDATLLTVTDKGFGRRTELDEYRIQGRGGYGSINYKVNDKKGHVCGIVTVNNDDDIIMIANDGIIIRMPVEQISTYSRYSGGVRVMKLAEGSSLVTFARAPKENIDKNDEGQENQDGNISEVDNTEESIVLDESKPNEE